MNKTIILIFCTVFAFLVMVSSCSNKLDEPGYNGFRCAFGNREYIADTAFYQRIARGTTITAQTAGKTVFVLYLQNNVDTIGTFNLDTLTNTGYYYDYSTNPATRYRSVSGSVVISQYFNDSLAKISGSFEFTGIAPTNSLYFSYGYFNNIPRH